MSEDDQRIIGQLTGRLDTFMDLYERDRRDLRDNIDKIFTKLDDISSEGCAVGRANSKAIRSIQSTPGKAVAGIAAIVSAIGAILAWWK